MENLEVIAPDPVEIPVIYSQSIFTVPSARVIRQALACRMCGNVGIPPYYQCESGHLLCGRHFAAAAGDPVSRNSNSSTSVAKAENAMQTNGPAGNLTFCKVHINDENADVEFCDRPIFMGNLELYQTLYSACTFNCLGANFGCEVKLSARELPEHIKTCYFNKVRTCPCSYCTEPRVRVCNLIQHIKDHGVPFLQGESNIVQIDQERLRRGEEFRKNSKGRNYYEWVGALIQLEGFLFKFVVRDEEHHMKFWLHSLKCERPPVIEETLANGSLEEKEQVSECQNHLDMEGEKKKPSSGFRTTITLMGPGPGHFQAWSGQVASGETSCAGVIKSKEYFKVYMPSLLTYKYKPTQEAAGYYSWNMKIEIYNENNQ